MRLLAIDGNSIIHRAFYGVHALANHKGVFTNALFGFMQMYLKEAAAAKADAVAVAFDLKSPTFRHQADPVYKANRKGMPEELAMQMPYLKQLLDDMGISCLTAEGFEADDILGTLAAACDKQNVECWIMTGDRDSLQLVTDRVTVRLVTNKETIAYTPSKFREDYGFDPVYLTDLKALMGDSSDNYSGVRGIGEKTALALIQAWNSIDNLYAHMEEVQASPAVKKKLLAGKDDAGHCKWLASIRTDVPVPTDPAHYRLKPQNTDGLRTLLTELEMYKILERLGLPPLGATTPAQETGFSTELPVLVEKPFSLSAIEALPQPVCYTLSDNTLTVCAENTVCKTTEESQILAFLSAPVKKAADDAKSHYHYAMEHHVSLNNVVFDAAVCGYLLNPSATDYSVAAVCAALHVPYHEALGALADVQALSTLYKAGVEKLEADGMAFLWQEVELPLTRVLASMEHEGVLVDPDSIRAFGKKLEERIADLQTQIYEYAGEPFNINSTKQLRSILFEKLHLPPGKKTPKGEYSTDDEVLETLQDKHPVINLLIAYRQYTKLQSTYVTGLLKCIAGDGRIHTNFRQTRTQTGRISSTEPNLQNIPVRTELGREMRRFFRAKPGCILLDADYSQIELRLMAHLSGDKAMQEAFRSGTDIHTATAAKIFDMPEIFVTPEMRSAAKAVNFGILYGMEAYSLSKKIHVSLAEARTYIDDYLGSFPKVSAFLEQTVNAARENGYVCTMWKRRRYVPELNAKNKIVQANGRRIAMNTPVQGTAADLIKLAMVHVHDRLEREVPSAKLLLQIHDELIVEVPLEHADAAAGILREEMLGVAELAVPLTADVNRGETWYDAKG